MIILGVTGSIAMGKSEAARMLRRFGVPVFDSDQAVHDLMAKGGAAVDRVEMAFPGVVSEGAVDRCTLGARVYGDKAALKRLEGILHPMVRQAQARFLADADDKNMTLAALDIPLLYETGGEAFVDLVAVVSAPHAVQKARALARPGMTEERLQHILQQQMPDAEKRARADYILPSGDGKRPMLRAIAAMLRDLGTKKGSVWSPNWPNI